MPRRKDFSKICEHCGREFLGAEVQIYCSVSCRAKHARILTRNREKREKEKKVQAAKQRLSLNAISWAAKQARMSYGQFVQQMTKEDEARICEEYAAYLEKQKEIEKEKKLTWI